MIVWTCYIHPYLIYLFARICPYACRYCQIDLKTRFMRNSYHDVCRTRVTNIQYRTRFEHTWCSGNFPTEIGNFAWETSRPVSPTIVSLVVT